MKARVQGIVVIDIQLVSVVINADGNLIVEGFGESNYVGKILRIGNSLDLAVRGCVRPIRIIA